jgi:hypothetical protein
VLTRIACSLNVHLKIGIFFAYYFSQVEITASMLPVSVGALPAASMMELSNIKDCQNDIVRAAKIKILAPQKLAKYCLSDLSFPPFLRKHKAILVRFKRTQFWRDSGDI